MYIEEQFNRRAGLLLSRVRAEFVDMNEGDVHQLLREVAHRAGVSVAVEAIARDAYEAEELLARPDEKEEPHRFAILALARAAAKLNPSPRRLEWAA